ncbi:Hydrogen peroxide stress regulator 1 [Paramyrothecium foliicola]|nr:Hydrogen peroxide stress regulator 1 [Paramyrothecium foliicola]
MLSVPILTPSRRIRPSNGARDMAESKGESLVTARVCVPIVGGPSNGQNTWSAMSGPVTPPDTKEKPYICHCGSAFARRDLLARHQRLQAHDDKHPSEGLSTREAAEADLAAAVSLSGLSTDPWINQQFQHDAVALHPQSPGRENNRHNDRHVFSDELLPSQLFNGAAPPYNAQAITYTASDTQFADFANFLDGVGLPAVWSPFFQIPERENEAADPDAIQASRSTESPSPRLVARSRPGTRPGTPFSSWLPSAPTENGIPNSTSQHHPRTIDPEGQRLRVTDEERLKLLDSLDSFVDILDPNFKFPSRHALTRYITSWFDGFHSHMPFIHSSTWQILDHPLEVILGISAVGAQYCFEHRMSERLFFAGKAILMDRLASASDDLGSRTSAFLALNNPSPRPSARSDVSPWQPIETVRALIALMGYATWEPKASMVGEAFALQGLLAHVLRDVGLEDSSDMQHSMPPTHSPSLDLQSLQTQWRKWVEQESCRRSKLIAFSFLHTHSVAYNVYPTLRSNEVRLRLPCSTKEWKATTASQWRAASQEVKKQQLYFQDALSLLLRNKNCSAPLDPIPTPLGNYVLLHGLLQRIHIVRDLSLPVMSDSAALPMEEVDKLERGLRSWTSGWQQAAESSLDPNNENGPIPFTSSSLLALAYVRIHLHLGPFRQLETRDPARIAQALKRSPNVERSDGIIAALLYSVHMLSIPVRLGVDRVARSQAFFWSVRHSLSSLECSILLSKWLQHVGDTMNAKILTDSEQRILHWVRSIIEEAYTVVDFENDDGIDDVQNPKGLGVAVLNIWAYFFKSNTQWPFINIIGLGLEKYKNLVIKELGQDQQSQA